MVKITRVKYIDGLLILFTDGFGMPVDDYGRWRDRWWAVAQGKEESFLDRILIEEFVDRKMQSSFTPSEKVVVQSESFRCLRKWEAAVRKYAAWYHTEAPHIVQPAKQRRQLTKPGGNSLATDLMCGFGENLQQNYLR